MRHMAETWAVVLAGGEGSLLKELTTDPQGLVIPKQYCSFERSTCLLQDAIRRAGAFALPSRICAVVASQHKRWSATAVGELDDSNVFTQSQDRGTAFGILLALLTLERRNPMAIVAFLPADHYFRDEHAVERVMCVAGNLAHGHHDAAYLLGTEPGNVDAELDYILPADKVSDLPMVVTGIKEKPTLEHAGEIIALGALWNLFILVGSFVALLALFEEDHSDLVSRMRAALKARDAGQPDALNRFCDGVEPLDFASDVLEVQAHRLQVLRVPACGWTDLGTPQRVVATLRGNGRHVYPPARAGERRTLFWSLAEGSA